MRQQGAPIMAGAILLLPLLGLLVPHSVAGHAAPAYAVCQSEDGSTPGQAFPCMWNAAEQGNGRGVSYVLVSPDDDILVDPSVTG